jgi:uroporphyrinogen-III decarboxylase
MLQYDVTFHPRWWHKQTGISFGEEFFFDPEYRIEADMKMRQVLFAKFGDFGLGEMNPAPRPLLGSDLIASGFLHSALLGCAIQFAHDDPPAVLCANLSDEAIMTMTTPQLDKSEWWRRIQTQIDYLQLKYSRVDSCINLMGVQNIALDLRGQELFIDYYEKPELVHHLLQVCTQTAIAVGSRLRAVSRDVSAGVTAIVRKTVPEVYLTSNCSVEMVSLDIYRAYLLPYDQMLAREFQPFGIHHCGQTMEHVADGYKEVDQLQFAEVGAFSDLAVIRQKLPNTHLNARYSPVRLKDRSLTGISEDILQMTEAGGSANNLSLSCVGIDDTVSDEQVIRFLSACQEIGRKTE